MSLLDRVVSRYLQAGDLVPFDRARVKNPHFVKIHNIKYHLSDDGGPLGSPEDHAEWAGNARVIMGPSSGKFKYLWVLDTDRKMVVMWRAHDGNEKVWDRASSLAAKLVRLDKRSQLNRVTHDEFLVVERAMKHAERNNESALKQYIVDNESDTQKLVNQLTQQYFDETVRPVIERAIESVSAGAIPIGWKAFAPEELVPHDRQKMTHVMSGVINRLFTLEKVESYIGSRGIDLSSPNVDNQAAEWAINDIMYAAYEEYLPPRGTQQVGE